MRMTNENFKIHIKTKILINLERGVSEVQVKIRQLIVWTVKHQCTLLKSTSSKCYKNLQNITKIGNTTKNSM